MKNLACALWLLMATSIFAHQESPHFTESFFQQEKQRTIIHTENFEFALWLISFHDMDLAGVNYKTNEIVVLARTHDLKVFAQAQLNTTIQERHLLEKALDTEYHNPDEVEAFLQRIHNDYPDITQLKIIGQSREGRNIYALKISDNPQLHEPQESSLLINSMHHAREVMSPEVSIDMIEYLTSRYGSDNQVTAWVDQHEIWVLPMLNVDGNQKVWSGKRMWRKNTRGGYGVDLNRNYPHFWGACRGSSRFKWSDTYRGDKPASEPETQAMMNLVSEIRPVFDISYHSYSELVLYPFGCKDKRTPTRSVVEKIGKDIAKALDYRPGTPWELLYSADGGDIDWMYHEYQVIPYVIELNSTSEGFQPSYHEWRNKTVELNRKGWMLLLDKLSGPGLKGMVKQDGDIVEFSVEVTQQDKLIQTYRGNPDGSFHIVLNEGDYQFTFKSKTRNSVQLDLQLNESVIERSIEL